MAECYEKYAEELKILGYYTVPGIYGGPERKVPKFNRPISPKENLRRYMQGDNPLWMPELRTDSNMICPYIMPDSYARAFGGTDWFGIEWQYEPNIKAAMVKPGTRRLSDITQWETELQWPDINAIDWEKDVKDTYSACLTEDKASIFVIQNGLFERTADLTSFEDTFCYLLEEQETLEAFYTKLTDWHIRLMEIAKTYYNADMILFHDDMGSQKGPFFSPGLYQDILLPHYQKITQAAHDMGMWITLHSCGSVAPQVPNFVAAGFDGWQGQERINDKMLIMQKYGEKLFQMNNYVLDGSISDGDAVQIIHNLVDQLGATKRLLPQLIVSGDHGVDLVNELYCYSRKKYEEK